MKRILFLNTNLGIGGAEKMQLETIRHLGEGLFIKKVCCLYGPGVIGNALASEGVGVYHGFMRNKYDFMGARKLWRLLKKERVDLLCLQASPLTLFWGFILGRRLKIPSIITIVHTMSEPDDWIRVKSGMVNSFILRRLDKIIVVSRAKMELLAGEYKLKREKLVLIHNGVDTARFTNLNSDGLRRKLGILQHEKVIGMVGRLVFEKAYDVFLKSARKIAFDFPDVKFLIVGDGKERLKLERLSRELGIGEKVMFLGERDDVPALISIFDVAVLSSRIESLPVVLLEYMAAEKPVVATDTGGNAEVVLNKNTGLIVPSEDPEALSGAIMKLIKDVKKAREMGKAARKTVEDNFSLKRMISEMERSFLDCIKDKEAHVRCRK